MNSRAYMCTYSCCLISILFLLFHIIFLLILVPFIYVVHGFLYAITNFKQLAIHEMKPHSTKDILLSQYLLISKCVISLSSFSFLSKLSCNVLFAHLHQGLWKMTRTINWLPSSLSCLSVYETAGALWTFFLQAIAYLWLKIKFSEEIFIHFSDMFS